MADIIQLKRGTKDYWASVNPILAQGEPALEIDTGKEKVGDGITPWNSLPYRFNNSSNIEQDEFTYTAPNNTFTLSKNASSIKNVFIGHGAFYNHYATLDSPTEVTISTSVLYGGEKILIEYYT